MKVVELEKNDVCIKMLFMEGSPLYWPNKKPVKTICTTELLGNDCGYNEGTICVVNG